MRKYFYPIFLLTSLKLSGPVKLYLILFYVTINNKLHKYSRQIKLHNFMKNNVQVEILKRNNGGTTQLMIINSNLKC